MTESDRLAMERRESPALAVEEAWLPESPSRTGRTLKLPIYDHDGYLHFLLGLRPNLAEAPTEAAVLEDALKRIQQVLPPRAEQPKTLIVDDSADNRLLIQHFVTRLGYPSETAVTGREAVEMAMATPYATILMDVQMPVMDGFEAVKLLRTLGYCHPIVALTAHTMRGDRERCLAGGFDDFLGKPINRDQLELSLRHFAGSSVAAPPANLS